MGSLYKSITETFSYILRKALIYQPAKQHRYAFFTILALLLTIHTSKAQNVPTTIVKPGPLLIKLRLLRKNSSDTALAFANQVIETAKETDDASLKCEALLELGRIYFAKDDQIKALETMIYAESISTPQNDCYYMAPQVIGYILNRQGKADEALQYLFKALKRVDSAGYIKMLASANFAIADAYRENKNSAKALGYALKGLTVAEATKDTFLLITAYNTLSNLLSNSDYLTEPRLDSAVYYQKKVMAPPIINKWIKPYDSAKNFSNMGRLYRMKQEFDLAKIDLDIAYDVAKRRDFKAYQQSILNELATLELVKGNKQKGLALVKEAKNILPANQTSLNRVKELVERTQEANGDVGNFKEAYQGILKANMIKDSLFSIKNQSAIAEVEKRYERDTKVLKANNLAIKNEGERNVIIFVSIIFIAVITAYFIWQAYKRRKQNEFLSTLIHEVNHRTKNNLQILNSLITGIYQNVDDVFLKGEIKKLRSYIKSFGLVYDNLNKAASFDDVDISAYTQDIGKAVLGNVNDDKFEFLYQANDKILISTDKAVLIGLIINELITNSLKYAFNEAGNNQILINLAKQKGNVLNLVYEDSGNGYKIDGSKKNSFGLKMIQQLVKQLKGSITFDAANAKRVNIIIPIS